MWHVSVSAWSRAGQMIEAAELAEKEAVRALTGVGGDTEWWLWNPAARVGHLRVPVTAGELQHVPAGCAVHDAGDTGPERPRTGPPRR